MRGGCDLMVLVWIWGGLFAMQVPGVCQEAVMPEVAGHQVVDPYAVPKQVDFGRYFSDQALRLELFQIGCQSDAKTVLHRIVEEPLWPGNRQQLIFPFPYGRCSVRVVDQASGELIHSIAFDTLFNEYVTTKRAAEGQWRAFPISVRIPKPKARFRVAFAVRRSDHSWETVWEESLKPTDMNIRRESIDLGDTVMDLQVTGSPQERLDLAFLAEGYTENEREKFRADAERMTQFLFEHEPFRRHRQRFNVRGVFRASQESGMDEPDQRRYRNTVLNASFHTLGIDRYLLTEDGHAVHQYAAQAPYDTVVVLVNSKRYGGGAICMDYCVTTVDHALSSSVFLHEFGHSLAYLADEYIGAVTYNELHPEGVEPVEPNITRSLDRETLKWRSLLTEDVPLPTTVALIPQGLDASTVVGAFEGGGYVKQGMYRPQKSCAMGDLKQPFRYCVVCEQAIERMIDYYAPSQME